MTLEDDFWVKLRRLELWHSDAVKAQDFSGPQTSHTKPGSVELRVTPYPHRSYWQNEWRKARNDDERERTIREVEKEWRQLSKHEAPEVKVDSKQYWLLDSGCYVGVEYRTAAESLSLEATTVYQWRKEKGLNPRTGREKKVA